MLFKGLISLAILASLVLLRHIHIVHPILDTGAGIVVGAILKSEG